MAAGRSLPPSYGWRGNRQVPLVHFHGEAEANLTAEIPDQLLKLLRINSWMCFSGKQVDKLFDFCYISHILYQQSEYLFII